MPDKRRGAVAGARRHRVPRSVSRSRRRASWRRRPDAPFTWVATDTTGYSPGFDVRGPDGRAWSVKLGPEAQTEVVASRILWAIGYHQPPTYYVEELAAFGRPRRTAAGGAVPRRLRRVEGRRRLVVVEERIRRHAAVPRIDRREHSAEQLGLEDVEQQDLSAQRTARGDSSCATSARRSARRRARSCCGGDSDARPGSGLAQRHRRTSNRRASSSGSARTRWSSISTPYTGRSSTSCVPADVQWTAELMSRLTDAQLDDAFRAAGIQPRGAGAVRQEDQSEDC